MSGEGTPATSGIPVLVTAKSAANYKAPSVFARELLGYMPVQEALAFQRADRFIIGIGEDRAERYLVKVLKIEKELGRDDLTAWVTAIVLTTVIMEKLVD